MPCLRKRVGLILLSCMVLSSASAWGMHNLTRQIQEAAMRINNVVNVVLNARYKDGIPAYEIPQDLLPASDSQPLLSIQQILEIRQKTAKPMSVGEQLTTQEMNEFRLRESLLAFLSRLGMTEFLRLDTKSRWLLRKTESCLANDLQGWDQNVAGNLEYDVYGQINRCTPEQCSAIYVLMRTCAIPTDQQQTFESISSTLQGLLYVLFSNEKQWQEYRRDVRKIKLYEKTLLHDAFHPFDTFPCLDGITVDHDALTKKLEEIRTRKDSLAVQAQTLRSRAKSMLFVAITIELVAWYAFVRLRRIPMTVRAGWPIYKQSLAAIGLFGGVCGPFFMLLGSYIWRRRAETLQARVVLLWG